MINLTNLSLSGSRGTVAENVCEGQAQTDITNRYFQRGGKGGGTGYRRGGMLKGQAEKSLSVFLLQHLYAE